MPDENLDALIQRRFAKYRPARHAADLFVAPNGNDKWSGGMAEPNAQRSDGPFATIRRAQDHLRMNRTPGPVTVWLRGGRYPLDTALAFGPEDAGPFTYAAYRDETPILDGGRPIAGWTRGRINNRDVWVTDLPEVAEGKWHFRQLFVNGSRRQRPRLPKTGCVYMEHVPGVRLQGFMDGTRTDCFRAAPGDVQAWENLSDVDIVAFHYWNEERMPIASFDPDTRMVRSTRVSQWPLKDDAAPRFARYWVENVKEALTEPGEWYLDRPTGRLYYLPMPGETIETLEAFAPRMPQLLLVQGDRAAGTYVTGLTFRGLRFVHTSWEQPGTRAGFEQAAANVPAVVHLEFARHCSVEDCTIEHVGMYGIELGEGCQGCRVQGNAITDTGAGGVKCVGVHEDAPAASRNHGHIIADNDIADGGKVFHSAVGILLIHSFDNEVIHNHIHHLEYSGISCGWVWGYGANPTRDNRIAGNHIHHIGSGLLNDMGGIYLLGEQPGTVIAGNLIHDVRMHNYGGWAIYADEGTSYVTIEKNVCHDTDSENFQIHYGRENVLRNNVFAFSRLGQVSLTACDPARNAFTFIRNIVLVDGVPAFLARNRETLERKGFDSDMNLFWDVSGKPVFSGDSHRNERSEMVTSKRFDLSAMRAMGYDRHSVAADPRFADAAKRDFRLSADSPALALGFVPIDLSTVGPRKRPG
jgi:hypothetical protein